MDRFDEIAGDYDMWLAIDPDYEAHHQLVMRALQIEIARLESKKEIWVFEIGCGTGYTSRQVLEANQAVRLVAIDKSPAMVERARRELASRGLLTGNIVIPMDITKTHEEYPRLQGMPIVVSVFMLHNIIPEQRDTVVQNMARALRPGGLLVIGDKIAHDDIHEHGQTMDRFWAIESKLKDFGPAGRYDFWHQHNTEDERMKMTETELATHLLEAGLIDISIGQRCGIGVYAIATARKPR